MAKLPQNGGAPANLTGQLKLARNGQTAVQYHGVFDLLLIDHIRHLERARHMGNVLVVPVTPDCYVNKEPNRPAFGEQLRAEAQTVATVGHQCRPSRVGKLKQIESLLKR